MSNMPVRNPDIVRKRLQELHGTGGLSFRKIAAEKEFAGIPPGTLCAILKGQEIPKRYRKDLGLPVFIPAPVCSDCGEVHVAKRCTNRKVNPRPGKHNIKVPDDVWEWLRREGNAGAEITRLVREAMDTSLYEETITKKGSV